jgi:hypothetical protein
LPSEAGLGCFSTLFRLDPGPRNGFGRGLKQRVLRPRVVSPRGKQSDTSHEVEDSAFFRGGRAMLIAKQHEPWGGRLDSNLPKPVRVNTDLFHHSGGNAEFVSL